MRGSLDPAGPVAQEMATLWWWMFGLGTAAFILFAVLLGLALGRRRRDDMPEPSTRWWLWGAGVVQPTVLVIVVFGLTLAAMRAIPEPVAADEDAPGPDDVVVSVIGHQWWYEIRYPQHDVVTANEIHIPAGRPVELRLSSADVIHSFWVPALAGKTDLFPDYTNVLVLEADEPGTYLGDCAEFCGLQHTLMEIRVIAHTPEDYSQWLEAQAQPAEEPEGEVAQQGAEIFQRTCAECHAIAGTPADGRSGPDLTHLASRETLATGALDNTRMSLREWITDPHAVKEGVDMPAADLDDDELDALLTYLEGLR